MTKKNQKFEMYSATERTYLAKLAEILKVNFTPSLIAGRCSYDGVFVKQAECPQIAAVEAKVRDMDISAYEEYIIERQKYFNLIDLLETGRCHKVLYVNFFRSQNGTDKAAIWSLHKLPEPAWQKMSMNAQTAVSRTKKKEKMVGMLRLSDAKIIDL